MTVNINCNEVRNTCSQFLELLNLSSDIENRKILAYQCLTLLDLSNGLDLNKVQCVEHLFNVNISSLKAPNGNFLVSQIGKFNYVTAHRELYDVLKNLKFLPFEEFSPLAEMSLIKVGSNPMSLSSKVLAYDVHVYNVVQDIYNNASKYLNDPRQRDLAADILHVIACAYQEDGIQSLTEYQAEYIKKIAVDILRNDFSKPVYMVDSPTGTGKTEVFLFATLLNALLGNRSVIIYPRKTLETDQAQRIIRRLSKLSNCISKSKLLKYNLRVPSLLIIDGDHEWLYKLRTNQGERVSVADATGKGLKCPLCSTPLFIQFIKDDYYVECQNGHRLNYIKLFKDDVFTGPSIIITNRFLLLTSAIRESRSGSINDYQRGFFEGVSLIVFDEAHVYVNLEGGDLALIMKSIRDLISQYGSNLRTILSSATVPNPVEFAGKLAQVTSDNIFYIDYQNPKFTASKYRVTSVIVTMPTPRFSAETLLQLVVLASMLWLRKYGYKGIVFIDSRTELGRIFNYIKETILERGGLDIRSSISMPGDIVIYHTSNGIQHLKNVDQYYGRFKPDNNALWDVLISQGEIQQCINNNGNCELLNDLKNNIRMTYAWDDRSIRQQTFTWFTQPGWKILLSTSSTELGIDIGDVSLVIQYKPPIRSEGFIQRLGRAGRDFSRTMGIAMGILVLSQSLHSAMYMYDEATQERLINIRKVPPYMVNDANAVLQRRAIVYQALMNALKNGKRTYWPGL